MSTYLLLRSNKESGPHSLEQLVQAGLKPYDLVWVSGKSAAWRYPSEIPELKQFAPAVEEQPFDRFYKKGEEKPADTSALEHAKQQLSQPIQQTPAKQTIPNTESVPLQQVQPVTVSKPVEEPPQPIPEKIKEEQPVSPVYTPKKSVFVTMPGGQQTQKQVVPEPETYNQYSQYLPPVQEAVPAKTITITENPVAAEIKYSQSLDDIKEMYVRTLEQRKKRMFNKAMLLGSLKKAAVVILIVGAGVAIGLSIRSKGTPAIVASESSRPQPIQNSILAIPQESVEEQTTPSTFTQEELSNTGQSPEQRETSREEQGLPGMRKTKVEPLFEESSETPERITTLTTEKQTREAPVEAPSEGVDVNNRTGERTRKTRETENGAEENTVVVAKPKATINKTLSKFVSVSSNEYQKVAFGGIRNLQLTVTNESKYLLDNVMVELQYLKPSELPLKTETVQFRAVAAGESMTIRIPDTNRGIKVTYRITNILSTQSAKDLADL